MLSLGLGLGLRPENAGLGLGLVPPGLVNITAPPPRKSYTL